MSEWREESILRKLHHEKEMTQTDIADKLGCSTQTVRRWLRRHDIEIRSHTEQLSGENHPNFKSNEPRIYPANWGKIGQRALERDGYRCQRCGMDNETHEGKINRVLETHHIEPVYSDKETRLEDVVTLCFTCHDKVEDWPVEDQRELIG